MSDHLNPFACGRCDSCESNDPQNCLSPRGGCRCAKCVAPPIDWKSCAEKAEVEVERLSTINADLLEALEGLEDRLTTWQSGGVPGRIEDVLADIVQARAAIAKARGTT